MVTFDFAIDIIKLSTSGQIAIYNSATNIFVTSYSADNVKITTTNDETVKVTFDNNDAIYFNINLVDNTQIQPAMPVAFAGTVYDLAELLATDFFFEVSIIEAADVVYDNAVSGLAATDVQDAIDEVADANKFTLGDALKHNFNYNFTPTGIVQVLEINFSAFAFEIKGEQNISSITIEVTNAAGAGKKFVIGIYANNGNGYPGAKIGQTTPLLGDLVAVQTHNFVTPLNLKPGLYFYCIMSEALNLYLRAIQPSQVLCVFGYSSTTTAPRNRGAITAGYAYNATMPATAPTLDLFSSAAAPFILLTTTAV